MKQFVIAGMLLATGMVQAGNLVEKAYSADKPNILLIISDDQGYGDFGFMGNTVLRTPQLDKLAASGAIFENYTTGVACSPGRAMLFSGRNNLSTGVWGVGARYGLRRDETLMPMFFRENGYSTFYLGKGDCVAPHRMPPHYAGWQESLFVGGYQHHNGRLYHSPLAPLHSIKPVDVEGWTSEFMTERGIEFMKEKKGSPWLLTMAYIIPHTPWEPVDERYAPYYRDKGCSATIAACFSHIEQMDTCVGQLLDTLKETGQDGNTIVVFVSDNGQTGMSNKKVKSVGGRIDHPDWAIRNVAGLRGSKSTAWENGTRVPLLVRMPGTIPAGMRTQFVTAEDVLPTLLDVAGISPDSVAHKPFSGVSVRPALLDEKAKPEHPEVFRITAWGEHSLTGKEGYIPDPTAMKLEDYHAVLRGPKFKLEMYPGGKVELHDIVNDKTESKDISKKHPEVTARMLVECRRQFRALIDDGAFRFSTIYIGDPRSKNRGGRTYFDSASRIQSHTGDIRVIPKLTGFAKEGDSVTYTIDSAAAGVYAISLTGTFADAAPLRVEVAGNVLLQQALNGDKWSFGTVNLPQGQFPLRLVAGKPKGEARAATVDDIFFEARRPAASKPLGLRPGANATPTPSTPLGLRQRAANPVKALAVRVRGYVNSQPLRFPNQHWVRGTYYAGLLAMYESTSDSAYLDDCMEWGKQVSWQINEKGDGPYDSGAYPLICGQIWYGCYQANKDERMMQPTRAFLEDPKVLNPLSAPKEWYLENTGHHFVDGLFTAPPALAMLYQMTGDEKYVNWMDACFWDVHGEIFDHDAGLFYRDARSKPRKTKNGKKVLWSRGNGWAFGGLTRILKHLPEHHASYARYKALYVQMAESLAKRQQADGFWRSNLDDPEQYTMKESSGTGFFCYGITWGINNGILNRERFLPVARKGWTALASVVNEDGQVGWSQPAGGGPGNVAEADTSKFGTGIFLLAASEVFLLTQSEARAATVDDIFLAARSPAASKPLGLQPGPNATILLNGKPYRGIGMNYFSCFLRTLKDGNDTSYDAGFATLAEKGIPFVRFCATGFWPRDMKLYVEDREEYFRRLDGVVHSAEKHGIGLIPSLFWYYACVPDLVGEPMDQWANPQSKTQAWMRQYVREVVTRYRDNPTIWAWELGNEFSLHANLPNAKDHRPKMHHSLGTPDARSARDDLTYDMVGKTFTAFATALRKHDPHRLIFTGDSFPRLSAWHQEQEGSWKHDSMEQFAEMLTKANPDPISGISLHAYEDDDQRFADAMEVARKLNKPIFIGEFGAQHETDAQAAKCRRLLKAIIDHEIPLAALWVFDHSDQKDFNIMPDNARAYQLDLIVEANRKLRTKPSQ